MVSELVHFTDWLPTLARAAGVEVPEPRLDGEDVLEVLAGEARACDPVRFWQNNRYAPRIEGNAAMREGNWKLVRPAIPATMRVTDHDRAIDQSLNNRRSDRITAVDDSPLPRFEIGVPPPPLLFDLADDPFEQNDLASAQPERTARMSEALEAWFEEVEFDRASIHDVQG
jgi:arylsulfatase A